MHSAHLHICAPRPRKCPGVHRLAHRRLYHGPLDGALGGEGVAFMRPAARAGNCRPDWSRLQALSQA